MLELSLLLTEVEIGVEEASVTIDVLDVVASLVLVTTASELLSWVPVFAVVVSATD